MLVNPPLPNKHALQKDETSPYKAKGRRTKIAQEPIILYLIVVGTSGVSVFSQFPHFPKMKFGYHSSHHSSSFDNCKPQITSHVISTIKNPTLSD